MARYEDIKHLLKPGMKVRSIQCGGFVEHNGKTATVEEIDNYRMRTKDPRLIFCFSSDELEILTDEHGNPWNPLGGAFDATGGQTFKVGDRVRSEYGIGTLRSLDFDDLLLVEYDNWAGGHDGDGKGKKGHCWWQKKREIEKIEESSETKPEEKPFYPIFKPWIDAEVRYYSSMLDTSDIRIEPLNINSFQSGTKSLTKKPTIMSKALSFVKNQALKATNPDEYELREAGLHNECGELTIEGESLHMEFLRELTREKMVSVAREMNQEKKESK